MTGEGTRPTWRLRSDGARLLRGPTAVDNEHAAGHVARGGAREENRRPLNFFELRPALQRRRAEDEFLAILGIRDRQIHLREERPRADGVDEDIVRREFKSER